MHDLRPTRRGLLAWSARLTAGAGLVGLASACSDGEEPPDPTTLLVERVTRTERHLLARARATLDAHPGLRDAVRPVVECHLAHLAALGQRATPTPDPDAETPTPVPTPPSVPDSPAAARRALAGAEIRASRSLVADLAKAPGALARLLASVAAAEASHHALLVSEDIW